MLGKMRKNDCTRKLITKMNAVDNNLQILEDKRGRANLRKQLERNQKLSGITRAKKSADYMNERLQEKLEREQQRIEKLKEEMTTFREDRLTTKNQLFEVLDDVKKGKAELSEVYENYSQMIGKRKASKETSESSLPRISKLRIIRNTVQEEWNEGNQGC